MKKAVSLRINVNASNTITMTIRGSRNEGLDSLILWQVSPISSRFW